MKHLGTGYGSDRCAPDTRKKIAAAQSGERAHNWQGDDVGYNGIHKRARVVLPMECEHQDSSCKGRLEVALRQDAAIRKWSDSRQRWFSPDVDDYMRLCKSHHMRYDGVAPPPETRTGRALARA